MIKEELVKRFESVVTQEIRDHKRTVQAVNHELQSLREETSSLKASDSAIIKDYTKLIEDFYMRLQRK